MRRTAVGVIALILIVAAVVLTLWPTTDPGMTNFRAAAWRIGAIMAAAWLAYPQLERLPAWALPGVLATMVIVVRWPRLLPAAIIVFIAMAILRPRKPKHASAARRSR